MACFWIAAMSRWCERLASYRCVPRQNFQDDQRDCGEDVTILRARAFKYRADRVNDFPILCDDRFDRGHSGCFVFGGKLARTYARRGGVGGELAQEAKSGG